jgi:hypothetical protein
MKWVGGGGEGKNGLGAFEVGLRIKIIVCTINWSHLLSNSVGYYHPSDNVTIH